MIRHCLLLLVLAAASWLPGVRGAACVNTSIHCTGFCNTGGQSCYDTAPCDDGWWGSLCDQPCEASYHCNGGCSKSTGRCSSCVAGYYPSSYCNESCTPPGSHCASNVCSSARCSSCAPGYYGDGWCQNDCPPQRHCKDGICSRTSASCSSCAEGYWGTNCEAACNVTGSHCKTASCSRTDGSCDYHGCQPGYWGSFCNETCNPTDHHCNSFSGGVMTCARSSGECSGSCQAGWWGSDYCNNTCSPPGSHCLDSSCSQSSGGCNYHGCEAGYWGSPWCNNTCDPAFKCALSSSGVFSCSRGDGSCPGSCQDGWWGSDFCNNTCSPPGSHCVSTSCSQSSGGCDYHGCQPGYWGSQWCEKECGASLHCKRASATAPMTCSRGNGECSGSCETGWWGTDYCNKTCNPPGSHCSSNSCSQSSGPCSSCASGYWGDGLCENTCDPSHKCRLSSSGQLTCVRSDGSCASSCQDGWWGYDWCNQTCSPPGSHCVDATCSQRYGGCSSTGCTPGHWGSNWCEFNCSSSHHCRDPTKCVRKDGSCPSSCADGWWGSDWCNQTCTPPGSHCVSSTCSQNNGGCDISGCQPGYYGYWCEIAGRADYHCEDNKYKKDTGLCNDCADGWWGFPYCNLTCNPAGSHCKGNACSPSFPNPGDPPPGCAGGCVVGYWDLWCDKACRGIHCASADCSSSAGNCSSCANGHWHLPLCDLDCPASCGVNGICQKESGLCIGCPTDKWGDLCTENCNTDARKCVYDSRHLCNQDGSCTQCITGYWNGTFGCNSKCNSNYHCAGGGCDINTGGCSGQCENGYWGNNCEKTCDPRYHCATGCDKNSGVCPSGSSCVAGYWGAVCDKTCDSKYQCADSSGNYKGCDQITGECSSSTYNCVKGHWGANCENTCDSTFNCNGGGCQKSDGYCSTCETNWKCCPAGTGSCNCECKTPSCTSNYYLANGACKKCPAGRTSYAGDDGTKPVNEACRACSAGKSSISGQDCQNCGLGKFSAVAGGLCKSCPAGYKIRENSTLGAGNLDDACSICPAGRYSSTERSLACDICGAGTWSGAAWTTCKQCSENTYNRLAGSGSCEKCPNNGLTVGRGATTCMACDSFHYANRTTTGVLMCATCVPGRCASRSTASCDVSCDTCLGPDACKKGYTGDCCGQCATNYYTEDGKCHECNDFPWALFLGVIGAASIIGLIYWKGLNLTRLIRLKIAANYIQLVILCASVLVFWPGVVDWFNSFLRTILLAADSIHTECFSPWSWYQKIIASVWIPFLIVVVGLGVDRYFLWKRQQLQRNNFGISIDDAKDRKLRDQSCTTRRLIFTFISLTYAPVLQMLFSIHNCTDSAPPRLVADTSLRCDDSEYHSMVIFCTFFGILIGLGFPIACAVTVVVIQRSDKGLHNGDMLDSFGTIYEAYRDDMAWFESVILVYKGLLLVVLSFLDDGVGQAGVNLMISAFYLAGVYKFPPFRSDYVAVKGFQFDLPNQLEFVSAFTNCINHVIAFLVGVSNNFGASAFFGVIFLLLNFATFGAMFFDNYFKAQRITEAEEKKKLYMELGDMGDSEGPEASQSGLSSSLMGDHVAEACGEFYHHRNLLKEALTRRNWRYAESLHGRIQHLEGRLLTEVERQKEVGQQTLNVKLLRLISEWKEQHDKNAVVESGLLADVMVIQTEYDHACQTFDFHFNAALDRKAFFPEASDAWSQLETVVFTCGEKLRAMAKKSADAMSFPAADAVRKLLDSVENTASDKLGPPDVAKGLKYTQKKWDKKLKDFSKKIRKLKAEAAAKRGAAATDKPEEDLQRVLDVYEKMQNEVNDMLKMFANKVSPAYFSNKQFRELQSVWANFYALLHEDEEADSGSGDTEAKTSDEVDGDTDEPGRRGTTTGFSQRAAKYQHMCLQHLMSQFAKRHGAAKELLSQGKFDEGEKEIQALVVWLLGYRAEVLVYEEMCVHHMDFDKAIEMRKLHAKCTELAGALQRSGAKIPA